MKKQKENSHGGITWSEMGKQNVQAEKVYLLLEPASNNRRDLKFPKVTFSRSNLVISRFQIQVVLMKKDF